MHLLKFICFRYSLLHFECHLNLHSQSPWFLIHGLWSTRPGELDHRLKFENEEMTLQMQ